MYLSLCVSQRVEKTTLAVLTIYGSSCPATIYNPYIPLRPYEKEENLSPPTYASQMVFVVEEIWIGGNPETQLLIKPMNCGPTMR